MKLCRKPAPTSATSWPSGRPRLGASFRKARPLFLLGGLALLSAPSSPEPPGYLAEPDVRVEYDSELSTVPDISHAPDGSFVIVWQSYHADGSGYGIRMQRFDRHGAFVGGELGVNSHTTEHQRYAVVRHDHQGNFVVAWWRQTEEDPVAQRFDRFGQPRGGEFLLNSYTSGYQSAPDLLVFPDGGFLATWVRVVAPDWSEASIWARRFDAQGVPLAREFRINSADDGFQGAPRISAGPAGDYLVAWTDTKFDEISAFIAAQRFDSTGARIAEEFVLSDPPSAADYLSGLSHSPSGDFVVTWARRVPDDDDGYGGDISVHARRFESTGLPIGDEFRVHDSPYGWEASPAVSVGSSGSFVVVWENRPFPQETTLRGQLFDPDGHRVGVEFTVNTYTPGVQRNLEISHGPDGSFVVVAAAHMADVHTLTILGRRYVPVDLFGDGFESGDLSSWDD